MHPLLPEFYRLVQIEPQADMLERRSDALDKGIDEVAVLDCLGVARIFLDRHPDSRVQAAFADIFRANDPVFPTRNNEAELAALAGFALFRTMEEGRPGANASAYALVSADAFGHGAQGPIPDVLEFAQRYLHEKALDLRTATGLGESVREALVKAPTNPFAGIKEIAVTPVTADWNLVDAQVRETRTQLNAVLVAAKALQTGMAKSINQLSSAISRLTSAASSPDVEALREETEILWWLFGERSVTMEQNFNELQPAASPVVIGWELAGLTRLIPGPVARDGLLARGLRLSGMADDEVSPLAEGVSALSRDWREAVVGSLDLTAVGDLAPVLSAVVASLGVADQRDWMTAFDYASIVPSATAFSALELAGQCYNEAMLVRAVGAFGA
jgi:hypothetical protein